MPLSNSQGFTLAELIVSIFIISLLSATFIANYHSAKRSGELNITAQNFASSIRMVQNYTLGMKKFEGNLPIGGWGVNIAKGDNKYTIFVDMDKDGEMDATEMYKIIYLPDGINITSIKLNDLNINFATNIIFIPPNPNTNIEYIKNNGSVQWPDLDKAEIELSNSTGSTKNILINKFGLVDVEN